MGGALEQCQSQNRGDWVSFQAVTLGPAATWVYFRSWNMMDDRQDWQNALAWFISLTRALGMEVLLRKLPGNQLFHCFALPTSTRLPQKSWQGFRTQCADRKSLQVMPIQERGLWPPDKHQARICPLCSLSLAAANI